MQSGTIKSNGGSWTIDMTTVERRPVSATADIRRVGLTETPDVIAIRFYFEPFEHLVPLPEPSKAALGELREVLLFTAKLTAGDPITFPSDGRFETAMLTGINELIDFAMTTDGDGDSDTINDLWKAEQCLKHLIFGLFNSGVLALTPLSRPLIQLAIELQDLLFGRRNGSLLQARLVVRAARRAGGRTNLSQGDLPLPTSTRHTAFQRLVALVSDAASRIDTPDDPVWLQACSHALEAVIVYLESHRFPPLALGPLKQLAAALREELEGRNSDLFEDHLAEFRHGPELSPRRPPRLHRHYFDRLLVVAMERFREVRKPAKLTMGWFDQQLQMLELRDENGQIATANSVRRYVGRHSDAPKEESGWFRYRLLSDFVIRSCLWGIGLVDHVPNGERASRFLFKLREHDELVPISDWPPEVKVQIILQTALLYQPRFQSKRPNSDAE